MFKQFFWFLSIRAKKLKGGGIRGFKLKRAAWFCRSKFSNPVSVRKIYKDGF